MILTRKQAAHIAQALQSDASHLAYLTEQPVSPHAYDGGISLHYKMADRIRPYVEAAYGPLESFS